MNSRMAFLFVHRTEKSFSNSPIDLTLEQIINVNAANQKKGITSITNLIGARQCWGEPHSLTMALLTQMFNNLGMNNKEDVSRDLKPYKIKSGANPPKILAKMRSKCKETVYSLTLFGVRYKSIVTFTTFTASLKKQFAAFESAFFRKT